MPGTAFGERAAPFGGVKGLAPGAVGLAPAHEAGLGVEEIGVVYRLPHEPLGIGLAANGARELGGAEVVVGVFEGLGGGLGEAGFAPHAGVGEVANPLVELSAVAPDGAAEFRRLVGRVVQHGGDGLLGIERADALGPAIGQEREGVVADHAVAVAGAGPGRQPAALVIGVEEAL